MCWNQHVSLNTFLFSSFVLLLIIYNNYYTQYKIKELNNLWIYIFLFSFISMQLIEFFIWRNINNKYNKVFSIIACLLLLFQPIASLMMLKNIELRNILLTTYVIGALLYSIYKFNITNIYSTISKSGHLNWSFFNANIFFLLCWLFFFTFSLFYERKWIGLIFAFILLLFALINYMNDNTVGSMWCWIVNTSIIYYAIYLLIYLPFKEKNKFCSI
jgi:hypothetical protein